MVTCPSCGRENPDGFNFCGQCGTRLAADERAPDGNGAGNGGHPQRVGDGRYRIQSFLGEGGRKRVYLAHDSALDRDVAIGLVKTAGLDERGRVRVQREAQAMAGLGDHPHIVTVYDMGEEHGEPYIVSQYMAGGALADVLDDAPDRRLDLETIVKVGGSVCWALEHAHAHSIVHRDLKPANVWLAVDGTAKLGDFGLAFSLDNARVTRTGAIVGTAAYMAREQALGHQPDAASDLYSLGAMLYEMVTGRPPFVGDDVVAVISQHANAEPVAPSWHVPGIPDELERLILDLLAKSPAARPANAAEVRERLAAVPTTLTAPEEQVPRSDDQSGVEGVAEGVFVGRQKEVDRL